MKNRKYVCAAIAVMVMIISAGCGESAKTGDINVSSQNTVSNVLEQGMAEADKETGSGTGPETVSDTESNTGSETETNTGSETGINSEPETGLDTVSDTESGTEPETESDTVSETASSTVASTKSIDVDLTALSSTMVYSEVYNMMTDPGSYIGKTVKMSGVYAVYHDESTGKYYHACIISDATACCSQGIEFELKSGYSYPDDYPEEGGEICVTGTFDTYEEGEYTYCTLRNASL